MDFFNPACQSGPFSQERFGLCDDQNATRAYVDTATPEKWVATVENPARRPVTFTAIDKCVIQDCDELDRGRCDGMLTTEDLLYLVELKDQKSNWKPNAIEQLKSTIFFLRAHHDLSRFRTKKAFACNKRHKPFAHIDQDFRFPSFPRRRESSNLLKKLDTRFRGYDELTGLAKVLLITNSCFDSIGTTDSESMCRRPY